MNRERGHLAEKLINIMDESSKFNIHFEAFWRERIEKTGENYWGNNGGKYSQGKRKSETSN